jgi:hypothetical protein
VKTANAVRSRPVFQGPQDRVRVALEELQSIHQQKHGLGRKQVFGLRNSAEFGVQFGSRREAWLLAFGAAIRQIRPRSAPRYRKELIEFA